MYSQYQFESKKFNFVCGLGMRLNLIDNVVATCAGADIPSDPPFAGWAHNFHDRPAYPLTLLQNPHCEVHLATSWPSGCFSLLLYLERASKCVRSLDSE